MKTKRRGVKISCATFRVVPDAIVDLWRQGQLHDSSVKVWILMQRLAYEHKGEVGFNLIQRYCGVGRATLSRALKQLMSHGLIRREGQVYTVVFEQTTSSTVEPPSSKMEPTSSTVEPPSSKMEPTSSTVEPPSSKMEPQLNSDSPRELRRHVDRIGDSPETPTPRCAASPVSLSSSNGGVASADSHIHISDSDLALLAERYGIRFARQPSPWAAVIIRNLLDGEGGAGHIEILRALAARGNGDLGGAGASAPPKHTLTNGGA